MVSTALRRLSFLTFLPAILISCSQESNLTQAGSGIIREVNPGLTEMEGTFRELSDKKLIIDSLSLPRSASDNSFGHFPRTAKIITGAIHNLHISGYAGFNVPNRGFDAGDTVISAYLHVNAHSHHTDSSQSHEIRLYSTEARDADQPIRASLTDTLLGTVSITKGSKDSIELSEELTNRIFDVLRFDTTGTAGDALPELQFGCIIPDSSSDAKHLSVPYIILTRGTEDGVKRDSIVGSARYTVHETDTDSLSLLPVSRQSAGRVAVMEFDLSELYNSAESGYSEVLMGSLDFEEIPGRTHSVEKDTLNLRYMFLDMLIEDHQTLTEKFDLSSTTRRILFDQDTTLSISIRSDLQKFLRRNGSGSGFLYIKASSSKEPLGQVITWPSPFFNAVLTTIK